MRTKVMLLPRSARFLRAVVVTLLVVGGLTAWSATPAVAVDNGDGTWTCVSGEICFKKHDDTYWNRDIKHFYWSQQHGGYNWCACDGGSGGPVAFNASMIYNETLSVRCSSSMG